jgi:group I intron endonuclease
MAVYGVVYVARNTINGKCYVGQTIQPIERRFDQHRRRLQTSRCRALKAAITHYGATAFEFFPVVHAFTKAALDEAEIAAIDAYDALAPTGYNIKTGGSFGKHSAEARQRISIGNKGKKRTSAQRECMRARMLGTSPSVATREKIAAALRGQTLSATNKAALIAANTGRLPTPEARAKMSRNRSGIPVSEVHKQKLRLANTGKRASAITRSRMSAAQIARWAARKIALSDQA